VQREDRDAIVSAAATAAGLAIEHIAFYGRRPMRLSRPVAYAIGTATIGAGFSGWAWRSQQYAALRAYWLIASAGGATVLALYAWRDRRAAHRLTLRDLLEVPDGYPRRSGSR